MNAALELLLLASLLARFLLLPEARPVGAWRAALFGLSQGALALVFFEPTLVWGVTAGALALLPALALGFGEARRGDEAPGLRLALLLLQAGAGLWFGDSAQLPFAVEQALARSGLPPAAPTWAVGLLLCLKESNFFVRWFFSRLRTQPGGQNQERKARDTTGNGRVIGSLERLLIYVFLLAQQNVAISVVIAIKALARFKRMEEDQAFAEYVIIGTFLSLLLTLAIYGGVLWTLP